MSELLTLYSLQKILDGDKKPIPVEPSARLIALPEYFQWEERALTIVQFVEELDQVNRDLISLGCANRNAKVFFNFCTAIPCDFIRFEFQPNVIRLTASLRDSRGASFNRLRKEAHEALAQDWANGESIMIVGSDGKSRTRIKKVTLNVDRYKIYTATIETFEAKQ